MESSLTASCCQTHVELTCLAEELQQEALDPTLASCCQRDLEDQAKAALLRARLTAVDRSNARLQVARAVVGAHAPYQECDKAANQEAEGSDEEVLAKLRAVRLKDLQKQSELSNQLQSAGHGALRSVPATKMLEMASKSSHCAVCHWATEGLEACNTLDEHLSTLAHRYPGTRCLRAAIPRGPSPLLQAVGLAGPDLSISRRADLYCRVLLYRAAGSCPHPYSPPLVFLGVSCFREGALVGSRPLQAFLDEDGEVMEEEVSAWLKARRVLSLGDAAERVGELQQGGSLQEQRDGSSDEEDGDGQSWQPACEVCGRRYPHQHVRSSYVSRTEDSSEDDEIE